MGPATQQKVAFGGNSQELTFGETGTAISVELPAGETTLILDLSNPLTLTVAAGEAEPEPAPEPHLYFSGIVNWNGFDDYITLYDEETLSYGGAHWINSEWGYRAYPQADWAVAYKGENSATGLSGSLILAESSNDGNIPAPKSGLYVMDFNMKKLTYSLTKIETRSEEHTSELQSRQYLVCRLLLEK